MFIKYTKDNLRFIEMDSKTLYTVPAELLGNPKILELQAKLVELEKVRQERAADVQKKLADLIPTDVAIDAEIKRHPGDYQGPLDAARSEARQMLVERYDERERELREDLVIGTGEIDGQADDLREEYGLGYVVFEYE